MRFDVAPRRVSAVPGQSATVNVTLSNTTTVITGHRVRVLGVDPKWVEIDVEELSLFPDSTGLSRISITLPAGIPAGRRTVSVEITQLTPPFDVTTVPIELIVPEEPGIKAVLDPVSLTSGGRAEVAVVVENTGNAVTEVTLSGADEEGAVSFDFDPPRPVVAPGEQAITTAHLRARRPWFGSPKVRPFTVAAGPPTAPVVAMGAWIQRPRFSRGAMALIGLAIAATVFAVVITASLSQVVNRSDEDRNLAIQVAQAAQASASTSGSLKVLGAVTLLTSGEGVPGVSVDLYQAANLAQPIVSTATDPAGGYQFSGLPPGTYKVQFQGAGFAQLWYPDSLTSDNASPITLQAGQKPAVVSIRLGGLPGSVSGQVLGADAAGAVLTLESPSAGGSGPTAQTASVLLGPTPPASETASSSTNSMAVVATETLDASGSFVLSNIPSPAVYDLVITKAGYATASQEVDLAAGEQRKGLTITLHLGNGSVAGTVSSLAGPLGGATITASDGTTTVSTISLSAAGTVGQFVLDGLPTPDSLTVVVTAPGYASQTLSVSLTSGQQLAGLAVTLVSGVGSISGTVSTAAGGPAGGVTVTATDGRITVSTVTLSVGKPGTYSLSGLPVPDTLTVTFSRPDLSGLTQSINLTETGSSNLTDVNATLESKTGTVFGTVSQSGGQALGEVTVVLSSGTSSYQVQSATIPKLGSYDIDGVSPGTYTISFTRQGGQPVSSIVTIDAGQQLQYNPVLNPAASISGLVVNSDNPDTRVPVPGAQVTLYLATQYPTVPVTSVLTDKNGNFSFQNVDAPESFVVAFAYPQGSAPQATALVDTSLGTASKVCGSGATGGATPPKPNPNCNPATDPIVINTGKSAG